jgi:parallel beta-helix repeat protein
MLIHGLPAYAASRVHVSPAGDDSADGSATAPVRSLAVGMERARAAAQPCTIDIAEGRYELETPLEFRPEDSGREFRAADGASPIISGGRRLRGWRQDLERNGLWRLTLPEVRDGKWYFHQLFADGQRLQRARTPNEGLLRTRTALGTNRPIVLSFRDTDLKPQWANLPDARLIMLQKWTDLHLPIQKVDGAGRTAEFPGGPVAYWMNEPDARYWIENVPDALDHEGEWYLDRSSGELSLLAPAGMNPNQSTVVAPRLVTLVRVAGDPASMRPVNTLRFKGIRFAETDYEMPRDGLVSPQAAMPVRGAFRVEFATDCSLEDCTFENLGGYALDLGRGAQRWHVARNEIRGSGAGGIRIGEPGDRDPDAFTACHGHQVTHNHLHALGRIFAPAVGVIIFQSGDNRIGHNHIHDLYYTAISVGWNWGYRETPCRGNIIEFNHLHDIGQGFLSDMGGVYTLGIQRGTVVRNNLIHDVTSYQYGGWGLYTDEGSTDIVMENNIVYRCKSAGFHQHYGRENVVRNNIFAFNSENQLMRSREEDHISFYFTNNIVYFDSGNLLGSTWRNDRFVIDGNLYFDTRVGTNAAQMKFVGADLTQWRQRGHDTRSLIADPLFVNPGAFDFRLQSNSPAFKLGFRPLDPPTGHQM